MYNKTATRGFIQDYAKLDIDDKRYIAGYILEMLMSAKKGA